MIRGVSYTTRKDDLLLDIREYTSPADLDMSIDHVSAFDFCSISSKARRASRDASKDHTIRCTPDQWETNNPRRQRRAINMELRIKQSQVEHRQLHKTEVRTPFLLRRHARCSRLGGAYLRPMSTCPPSSVRDYPTHLCHLTVRLVEEVLGIFVWLKLSGC